MQTPCPHCSQLLEIDASWIGHELECPLCQKTFALQSPRPIETPQPTQIAQPTAEKSAPSIPSHLLPQIPKPPTTPTPQKKKGGGMDWLLLILLLLGVGGFTYTMVRHQESPQRAWKRIQHHATALLHESPRHLWRKLTDLAGITTPAPRPTATPVPTPVSTPIPTPTPTPTPEATPTPTPFPTATPDPIAWLVENPAVWPREIKLTLPVNFPIIVNGQPSGSVSAPAGSILPVVKITQQAVSVTFGSSTQEVPPASTDLAERISTSQSWAEARAKAKQALDTAKATAAAALPSPTPIPASSATPSSGFVHPGMLSNAEDFERMRSKMWIEPWKSGWQKLIANRHASLDWKPNPVAVVVRGSDRAHMTPQNYKLLFNDVAAAYACALRWKVTGDRKYADKSVEILNAWSSTLTQVTGSSDACLAAGIYGYEFANAAEIMRTYENWKPEDFARFQKMMMTVFYPINKGFLEHHNGTRIDHYWANWDLCNMASMMAIGILCDDRSIYENAVEYFKHGKGNGAIEQVITYIHPGGLGQWQESGRDQGHNTMGIAIMAAICEMAWKQGDDLYGYDNNRFLTGCEYVAKYNLGEDVPYKPYLNTSVPHPYLLEKISSTARGSLRPGWELVYNHYVKRKGLSAPYSQKMAEKIRPEGGGGDYGPNSGGYDQIGYGTFTATLDDTTEPTPSKHNSSTPSPFGTLSPAPSPTPESTPTPESSATPENSPTPDGTATPDSSPAPDTSPASEGSPGSSSSSEEN